VRYVLAVVLDCLLLSAIVAALFILLTGGGVYTIGHMRVSARVPDNLLLFVAVVLAARYAIRDIPWFAVWTTEGAVRVAERVVSAVPAWARELPLSSARQILLVLVVGSVVLKTWFAATSPGFVTGDDVEIHEMSLGLLLHQPWPIWDLRSAVFPLGVVFPAQYIAHQVGVRDVGVLVFIGRLVVAVLSTVSIWLVWLAGRRLWPDAAGLAILAAGFFATAKLTVAFGSSELPRPVATVFVLAAFSALQRRDDTSWRWAAVALAFAASLRFSEAMFVAAALTQLVLERRYRQAAGLILITAVLAAMLLGVADAAYWGEAFHSLRAAFDFTVVQRLSSRGFGPPWWYLVSVGQWSTLPLAILAGVGLRHQRSCAIWVVVPLCALSVLPHKEARYMIPVVPFVCLAAARFLSYAVPYVTSRIPAVSYVGSGFSRTWTAVLQTDVFPTFSHSTQETRHSGWRAPDDGGRRRRSTAREAGSVGRRRRTVTCGHALRNTRADRHLRLLPEAPEEGSTWTDRALGLSQDDDRVCARHRRQALQRNSSGRSRKRGVLQGRPVDDPHFELACGVRRGPLVGHLQEPRRRHVGIGAAVNE